MTYNNYNNVLTALVTISYNEKQPKGQLVGIKMLQVKTLAIVTFSVI